MKTVRGMRFVAAGALLLALAWPGQSFAGWLDWWLTPAQQGWILFEQGRYLEAAKRFQDPAHQGAALYRGGDFAAAAAAFGRLNTPEAYFNRGNALLMSGEYGSAIESYERALQLRPGWDAALRNLQIARLRKERLAPPEDDAGGTGGQLAADEIVFDESGRVDKSGSEEVTEGGEQLSEAELRAVWLRRVSNDPGMFLRARFAYQLYRDGQHDDSESD